MCAPTSTNPLLMASRSNRPQQPHILQRSHVHNSFARLKKKKRVSPKFWQHISRHNRRNIRLIFDKVQDQMWRDSHNLLKVWISFSDKYPFIYCTETSTKTIKKKKESAVVISDIFPYGRAEAVGLVSSRDSEKQAQLSLVASSGTIRPNWTHNPPI